MGRLAFPRQAPNTMNQTAMDAKDAKKTLGMPALLVPLGVLGGSICCALLISLLCPLYPLWFNPDS